MKTINSANLWLISLLKKKNKKKQKTKLMTHEMANQSQKHSKIKAFGLEIQCKFNENHNMDHKSVPFVLVEGKLAEKLS